MCWVGAYFLGGGQGDWGIVSHQCFVMFFSVLDRSRFIRGNNVKQDFIQNFPLGPFFVERIGFRYTARGLKWLPSKSSRDRGGLVIVYDYHTVMYKCLNFRVSSSKIISICDEFRRRELRRLSIKTHSMIGFSGP